MSADALDTLLGDEVYLRTLVRKNTAASIRH